MKVFYIAAALCLCLQSHVLYAGKINKWVDEQGNVHYGDSPPANSKAKPVNVSRPPSNPGKPLPRLNPENQPTQTDQAAPKNPPKTREEANQRACQSAKDNLKVISENEMIRTRQADGSEKVLTAEEIEQRRIKLESDIKQYCK